MVVRQVARLRPGEHSSHNATNVDRQMSIQLNVWLLLQTVLSSRLDRTAQEVGRSLRVIVTSATACRAAHVPPVGRILFAILVFTSILSLKTPSRQDLIPYAPFISLTLQLVIPLLVIEDLRLKVSRQYWGLGVLFVGFVGLFLLAVLSSLWSRMPDLVLQRSFMVFVPLLMVSLLVWADPYPLRTFNWVAHWIVSFVTILAIIGVTGFLFGTETSVDGSRALTLTLGPVRISQAVYGVHPFLRISSLLGNPNAFAVWLVMGITLAFHLLRAGITRPPLLWVALSIQIVALTLTFSRTGIATTMISLMVFFYWAHRRRFARLLRLLVVMVIAGIVVFLSVVYLAPIDTRRFSLDLNERQTAWGVLIEAIERRPLLGVGFGVSYEAILEPAGVEITAHNAHLQTLAEVGLGGYVIVTWMWIYAIWTALKSVKESTGMDGPVLAVICSLLIAFFCHQVFEGHLLRYGFTNVFLGYLLFVSVHPGMRVREANFPYAEGRDVSHHGPWLRRRGNPVGAPG